MTRILIALILVFSTLCGTAAAEAGRKIAFLDAAIIFDNSDDGKKAQEKLKAYVESRQRIIDLEEEELKTLENELKKQSAVLSPATLDEKRGDFQKKLFSYKEKVKELTDEIQHKKMEVLKNFNKHLEQIVKQLSKKNGYDMVLDRNPELGIIVYGGSELNITDMVLEEMKKKG